MLRLVMTIALTTFLGLGMLGCSEKSTSSSSSKSHQEMQEQQEKDKAARDKQYRESAGHGEAKDKDNKKTDK
jgi:hypothetical protein